MPSPAPLIAKEPPATAGRLSRLIQKAKKAFSGKSFIRTVTVLAGGTAGAQIITALAAPALTRLYTPADFGAFAIFSSLLSWFLIAACMRFELALPIAENDQEAERLLWLSIAVLTGASSLLLAAGVLIALIWPAFDFGIGRIFFFCALPTAVFVTGAYQIGNYRAIRHKAYPLIAKTKVAQSFVQIGTQIASGFFVPGPFGLIAGGVFGKSAGVTRLLADAVKSRVPPRKSWKAIFSTGRKFSDFPLLSTPSALLHAAVFHIPVFFLVSAFGRDVAGQFALQERVIALPLTFVAQAVAQAFYGEAAKSILENPTGLPLLFRRSVVSMFLIGLLPSAALALAGPWLFELVFGEVWREAGHYARILALTMLLRFAIGPVFYVLALLQKQKLQLVSDAVGVAVLLLGFGAVHYYGLPPRAAIITYGAAIAFTYLLLLVFSLQEVNRAAKRAVQKL